MKSGYIFDGHSILISKEKLSDFAKFKWLSAEIYCTKKKGPVYGDIKMKASLKKF